MRAMAMKMRWLLAWASTLFTRVLLGPSRGAGRYMQRIYVTRAGTRFYKLYLPKCYRGQALPLVVMLHGCKQTPDDFAAGTRMNQLADEYGFIVVYPAQAWRANIERCWNWFRSEDQRRDRGEPAIIAGITRQVIARYRVDARRVYIAGLSAGGCMAAIMAATYPELYAAVGVHSGLPYAAASGAATAAAAMRWKRLGAAAPLPPIPMIVFHGDCDGTVHPSNGDYALPAGVRTVSGEASGRRYTRTVHRMFEHWLVHGAGHAWSGGNAAAPYADAKGPDAAREMLRFFFVAERDEERLAA
jgi:poly(hydroxyalkanoate) depolymerase family esterase